MTKTLTIALTVVLALAAMACWADSTPPQGPPPHQGPPAMMHGPACPAAALVAPMPAFADNPPSFLSLSDDQKQKLKTILMKNDTATRSLKESTSQANRDLFLAVTSSTPDAKKVEALTQTTTKGDADILKCEIDTWTQISKVLTADQMKKLTDLLVGRRSFRPAGPPPGAPGEGPKPGPSVPSSVEPPPPAPQQ
jgi:Spy/CpxP family protein refolding chaperone